MCFVGARACIRSIGRSAGYGYGSYALLLDEKVIITSDGDFGCDESLTFPVNPRQPTLVPTQAPSAPTRVPIPQPTRMPVVCGGCTHTLTLQITTDLYPVETTYSLKAADGFGECFDGVSGPDEWAKSTTYSVDLSESLCETAKYTFILSDSWGDGICCSE